jgi:hypothetical protein
LRVVDAAVPPVNRPYGAQGWLAAELLVQNVDALAISLAPSPFHIVRPPANLSISDRIRAMQVRGPGDEILYLTQFLGPVPGMRVPSARFGVDRPFALVLGGLDMSQMQQWYRDELGTPCGESFSAVVSAMSVSLGLPLDTRYEIAALPLKRDGWLELDVMPANTPPPETLAGRLPAGICLASFEVDTLPNDAEVLTFNGPPWHGRRAMLLRGPAGERVELIAK